MKPDPAAAAFLVAALLVSGVFQALQPPTNAMLRPFTVSPINAALVSFLVGSAALAAAAVVLRVRPEWTEAGGLPWYAWMGGVYGAVFVAVAAYGTPRIGVAATVTLLICGQAVGALAIDHFGALGVARHPISAARLAGMGLVVAGVVLVRRG